MHMIKTKIDNTRLHLREEADGTGLLIINASYILYLDKIGMDFVKHYIRYMRKKPLVGSVRSNVVMRMMLKYKVSKGVAEADYDRMLTTIWGVTQGNACPFTCFDVQVKEPRYGAMKSPIVCADTGSAPQPATRQALRSSPASRSPGMPRQSS